MVLRWPGARAQGADEGKRQSVKLMAPSTRCEEVESRLTSKGSR
jgi:hypothetical protein